jgi:hypothetical protein
MTTWEPASESDITEIRVLLNNVRKLGHSAPIKEDELEGLTKQAGALRTLLREMLGEEQSDVQIARGKYERPGKL